MRSQPSKREIRACVERASEQFPSADRIIGRWYAGEPYAEVWFGRHARTVLA